MRTVAFLKTFSGRIGRRLQADLFVQKSETTSECRG